MPTSRRALVVRGGWEGHFPVETTDLFIPYLTEQGFEVRIAEGPLVYADADLMAGVDLVLQCVSMGAIAADEVEGLRAAVAAGTGLAGWHGGILATHRDSAAYLQLVGGLFAAHPGRPPAEQTGEPSDSFVPHRIEMLPAAATHPVTAGIGDFDLVTEQYWVCTDGYCDVLATTTQAVRPGDPWHRPVVSPAIWTRPWGQGRVFVATPGHQPDVLQHPSVRTIVERGLLWASR